MTRRDHFRRPSVFRVCSFGDAIKLWTVLQVLLLFPVTVLGDAVSQSNGNSPHHQQHQHIPPPPPPPLQDSSTASNSNTDVIQVVETESWDGERWIGAETSRWTTTGGRSCVSPADLEAPLNGKFEGGWKIVLGEERDDYGWNYVYSMSRQRPRRQRIWLRTVQLNTSSTVTSKPKPTTLQTLQRKSASLMRLPSLVKTMPASPTMQALRTIPARTQQLPALLQSALQMISDDWNFKGFGFSFYKSFLFKESFGLAFRIPLTTNWDVWDRHPEWPSFSMSVAFFYPFTAAVNVSGSVNVEWIKWCVVQLCISGRHLIAICLLGLARGFVLAGSALAFPLTRELYQLPDSKDLLPRLDSTLRDKPTFSTTLQERVGVSYSWRLSAKRGYETRRSVWHIYLPTLLSLLQHVDQVQQTCQKVWRQNPNTVSTTRYLAGFVPQAVRRRGRRRSTTQVSQQSSPSAKIQTFSMLDYARESKWAEWCQRKTGSLGVSTGYPIPDKPHFSCSAVLSLSGFYFQPDTIGGGGGSDRSSTPDAAPATTTTTTTTTASMARMEKQEDPVAAAVTSSALRTTTNGGNAQAETLSVSARPARVDGVKAPVTSKTASA